MGFYCLDSKSNFLFAKHESLRGEFLYRRCKEKGVLIHNLCKIDQQEAIFYCSFESMFDSMLMFVTKAGYIKLTSGVEFDTVRLMMAATKLEPKD